MSWEPQAVVIYGYKLPRDTWNKYMGFCEENFLDGWEDYFIDTNPATGNGDTFFGLIVTQIDEHDSFIQLESIRANIEDLMNLDNWSDKIYYGGFIDLIKYPIDYYIGVRWV